MTQLCEECGRPLRDNVCGWRLCPAFGRDQGGAPGAGDTSIPEEDTYEYHGEWLKAKAILRRILQADSSTNSTRAQEARP
jgi:hypothetical protein